jgi:hypothetical protein
MALATVCLEEVGNRFGELIASNKNFSNSVKL